MKKVLRLLLVVGVLFLLAGCTRPVTIETLQGRWVYSDDGGHTSTLTISEDGTFTIDVAPWQVFDQIHEPIASLGQIDWERSSPGAGRVTVNHEMIGLQFDEGHLDGIGGPISLNWPKRDKLYVVVGDPDDQINFSYVRQADK